MPRKIHPNSLKNLRPGPSFPVGNQYGTMAAQRRARIQQLCEMEARQLTNLKGRTVYDDMIIKMLKGKAPKDHELIMKADAPGLLQDDININPNRQPLEGLFRIPVDEIAPLFAGAYRDITHKNHTEYIFKGGRGSAKSSFVAQIITELLVNDPDSHALALRQVGETLRDSVFAQVQWAINKLGLSDKFKSTLSPMEIEYLPTGQKIYFRGGDDPGKIKSITPTFGYIKFVWFEELDQFRGQNAIRMVEQSIRGGDDIIYLKSFNPPPTKSNWANKYLEIPKATQYQHHSNYLGLPEAYLKNEKLREAIPLDVMIPAYANLAVPKEWLGNTWLEEAEHLKQVNPLAYEHEYLGIAVNDGGLVFPNVIQQTITDDQIKQFDRVLNGLDWGYAINPASYGKMNYDATRRILHVFGEAQYLRRSNESLFNQLVADGLIRKEEYRENGKPMVSYPDLIIADSAEPKSVGDFKSFGANIRGAEKGPESVRYSIKWLQGLTAIIIDPVRAPVHAQQFSNYEYERTKDGEIIDEYPDKDNDTIDDVRYATNLIWRRRGE
jgi:phage terminase large subunit